MENPKIMRIITIPGKIAYQGAPNKKGLGLGEHPPKTWLRRLDSQSQVAHPGFRQHRVVKSNGSCRQNADGGVWENMDKNNS